MAKVDAEFAVWANEQGEPQPWRGRKATSPITYPEVEAALHQVRVARSRPHSCRACEDLGGDLLVLGSSCDGRVGQVVIGSTAEPLLHSSGCPVAIAPRGYRAGDGRPVTRLTCSFSGTRSRRTC